MEGFQKDKYDEILGFKEKGLSILVMAAIGFRSVNDCCQCKPKVRKRAEDMFIWYKKNSYLIVCEVVSDIIGNNLIFLCPNAKKINLLIKHTLQS